MLTSELIDVECVFVSTAGNAGIFLAIPVISFVLLSWFLLICTMKIFKHKDSFCWRRRKEAEVSQNGNLQ